MLLAPRAKELAAVAFSISVAVLLEGVVLPTLVLPT